jgi:hypothetical protein
MTSLFLLAMETPLLLPKQEALGLEQWQRREISAPGSKRFQISFNPYDNQFRGRRDPWCLFLDLGDDAGNSLDGFVV